MTQKTMMQSRSARSGKNRALPFEPLVPNEESIAAMRETRQGNLPQFKTIDDLMKDLNAGE